MKNNLFETKKEEKILKLMSNLSKIDVIYFKF